MKLLRLLSALALRQPKIHSSLDTVVDCGYDGFILDQFGVLHNGVEALPGAVAAVERLYKLGKKMVILSNTSAPATKALERLPKYGFEAHWFIGAVTSGEEASRFLKSQPDPKRVLFWTWDESIPNNPRVTAAPQAFLDRCGDDVAVVDTIEKANWLLLHGSEVWNRGSDAPSISFGDYINCGEFSGVLEPLLQQCAKHDIPMVCANPDNIVVTPSGGEAYMPGLIAQRYREITGKQHHVFGKPDRQHFSACVDRLEAAGCSNVIHVGDSLHHDVRGALDAKVDVLFVSSGVHASALGVPFGAMASKTSLDELFKTTSITPTDVIPAFLF